MKPAMDLLVHSLGAATWVHEWVDARGLQQCRDGLNLDIFLLQPLKHKMPEHCSVCQQERQGLQMATGPICPGGSSAHSWQVGLMPIAPGGYTWVLRGMDTYSWLGIPSGRHKCSEYYKSTRTEDIPPTWMAKVQFLRGTHFIAHNV